MTQSDEGLLDTSKIREVVSKIEERNVNVDDVVAWLRVLSVHPSQSGDVSDGVVVRLGLRPSKDTAAVVVNNNSLAARLSEVGISFPIDLSREIVPQVDDLVLTIREDAPKALKLSEFPRIISVPTPTRVVDLVSAAFSLAITVAVAWAYEVAVAPVGWDLIGAAGAAALVALTVYILTTAWRLPHAWRRRSNRPRQRSRR